MPACPDPTYRGHAGHGRACSALVLPEDLLTETVHAWRQGRAFRARTVWRARAAVGPAEAGLLLPAIGDMLEAVAWTARREVRLGRTVRGSVTADHRAVLCLIGCLQAGEPARARAIAVWLTGGAEPEAVIEPAGRVARSLDRAGLRLAAPRLVPVRTTAAVPLVACG